MSNVDLEDLIESHQEIGQSICKKLIAEMIGLGFKPSEIELQPDYSTAQFEVVKDPYTGDKNLLANWYDQQKLRVGQLQFQSNGSIYTEYDVVKNHPSKPRWFVEAVTAWGKPEAVKTEAKLIPLP